MKKIILDTNFLMLPHSKGIDIFSEIDNIMDSPYKICILRPTLVELERIIQNQRGKHREAAKMALKLIELKKPLILDVKQKDLKRKLISNEIVVDDVIIEIAEEDFIIATQDKEFKKRLSDKGLNYIYLKNQKLMKNVL